MNVQSSFDRAVADGNAFDAGTRRQEYIALALMYFAQGLPMGLAYDALGTLIRYGGHSVAAVGLTGLAFIPWALKFLWAGAIDNACSRWGIARIVFVTQGLIVLACLSMVPFSPATHLYAALAGAIVLNALCATQDIVTNAYAVVRLQGRSAGAANAIQVAGFIAGMLVGGGGLLLIHARVGWSSAIFLLAVLLLVLYLPLLLNRRWLATETRVDNLTVTVSVPAQRVRLRDLRLHADLGWALLLALVFKFASTAVATLAKPWLLDRGFSLDQLGSLQISNMIATAIGGVLIGIPLVRRFGNRRAVLISMALAGLLLGTAWVLHAVGQFDVLTCYAAFALQSLFEGAMYVAIWALFLNWASPLRPGTDFTAMQCCESFSNAMAAGAIGSLGQHMGFGAAFAGAWLAAAVVLGVVAICLPRLHLAHEAPTDLPSAS
jgi:MFS transporter (putative signal transducer)